MLHPILSNFLTCHVVAYGMRRVKRLIKPYSQVSKNLVLKSPEHTVSGNKPNNKKRLDSIEKKTRKNAGKTAGISGNNSLSSHQKSTPEGDTDNDFITYNIKATKLIFIDIDINTIYDRTET